MSQETPDEKSATAPGVAPIDEGTDGARSGAGAQTALVAMLRNRKMRASRDADAGPPASSPAAE